ncbi:polysaccharide biosynthesis/export family protein [Moritella sp. 24]|uniref:polysaccharide export protein n=1 Tax=Moritella sp. 24 TaxID=2746230 RepID=UPI001BA548E7|nr:polysaccharide export protein [Moritella sp. 24]QUM75965.1 polysaccharide biosynthesis/export family protein [Moritella sp. 24]
MKQIYKHLLMIVSFLILTACTVPGSDLPIGNKHVVEINADQSQSGGLSSEQVTIYPLSPSFVARYNTFNYAGAIKTKTNPKLDKQLANYEYLIGPSDILTITIWNHPELTIPAGSFRSAQESGTWVHSDGTIFYPYIGFVKVEGKTAVEIRKLISTRLATFIETPQVDVNLAAFRSQKAYLVGEIKTPGKQPITNVPLTLLDAINQGGGLTADADWRNVSITSNGKTEIISLYKLMQLGDLTENRLMRSGDIIYVPRNDALKVFVQGEVVKAGMLTIDRTGMTLTEALSAVGGINELRANATGIFIVRSTSRDVKNQTFLDKLQAQEKFQPQDQTLANIYQLDLHDASALMTGTKFELEPYDVLYVTTAPISRWNRVMDQLLPTISAFNLLTGGVLDVKKF